MPLVHYTEWLHQTDLCSLIFNTNPLPLPPGPGIAVVWLFCQHLYEILKQVPRFLWISFHWIALKGFNQRIRFDCLFMADNLHSGPQSIRQTPLAGPATFGCWPDARDLSTDCGPPVIVSSTTEIRRWNKDRWKAASQPHLPWHDALDKDDRRRRRSFCLKRRQRHRRHHRPSATNGAN